MNNRKTIVPNNLKIYRLMSGLTQKEVATELGFCTDERISQWEHGKNIPNLLNLAKLSKLYRATPAQLYSDPFTQ